MAKILIPANHIYPPYLLHTGRSRESLNITSSFARETILLHIDIDSDLTIYRHPMSRNPLMSFSGWADELQIVQRRIAFNQIGFRDPNALFPPDGKNINTYLPVELLKEVFLYSIEVHQSKSGHLGSVCRYWRTVTTIIASLWSTLRVGTWTETEQVTIWLQRA